MADDARKLCRALEFVTAGEKHSLPANLNAKTFQSTEFLRAVEKSCKKAKPWMRSRGIQGLGVGNKLKDGSELSELALRVYVDRKLSRGKLNNAVPRSITLPELGKCRTDVVEIGKLELQSFTTRLRPAQPGVGVSHSTESVGTFGCLVRKRGHSGPVFILSNSHVLARYGRARKGVSVVQPARSDGGVGPASKIGELSEWVEFEFSASKYLNRVDAAIAKVRKPSVKSVIRVIGEAPKGVSKRIRRGMAVKKVGRTTDLTFGQVNDTNFRFFTRYPKPGGGTATLGFKDQVLCTRFTAAGDSGSAILNSRNRIVGMHLAGSQSVSVFSRISFVFKELDLELA